MKIYSDYEFYVVSYGGDMEEEEFCRIICKASAHVRRITFGRADYEFDSEEVKLATCAVCDAIWMHEKERNEHGGKIVSSENTNGYSVSYVTDQASGESSNQALYRKIYAAAEPFLETCGILNWGVYDDN